MPSHVFSLSLFLFSLVPGHGLLCGWWPADSAQQVRGPAAGGDGQILLGWNGAGHRLHSPATLRPQVRSRHCVCMCVFHRYKHVSLIILWRRTDWAITPNDGCWVYLLYSCCVGNFPATGSYMKINENSGECVCTCLSSVITEDFQYRWLIVEYISLCSFVCYYITPEHSHLRLSLCVRVRMQDSVFVFV